MSSELVESANFRTAQIDPFALLSAKEINPQIEFSAETLIRQFEIISFAISEIFTFFKKHILTLTIR